MHAHGEPAEFRQLERQGYHIWSSATLYDEAVQEKRRQWFQNWLRDRVDFSRDAILDFHRYAGEGDPWNDVIMNRNGLVQTVSITSIFKQDDVIEMQYHDLMNEQVKREKILLSGEVVGLR